MTTIRYRPQNAGIACGGVQFGLQELRGFIKQCCAPFEHNLEQVFLQADFWVDHRQVVLHSTEHAVQSKLIVFAPRWNPTGNIAVWHRLEVQVEILPSAQGVAFTEQVLHEGDARAAQDQVEARVVGTDAVPGSLQQAGQTGLRLAQVWEFVDHDRQARLGLGHYLEVSEEPGPIVQDVQDGARAEGGLEAAFEQVEVVGVGQAAGLVVDVFVLAQALEDEGTFADATATVEDDQGWTWAGVFGLEQFEFLSASNERHNLGWPKLA